MKANFRKNFKRLAKAIGLLLLLFISLMSLMLFSTGFQKFVVSFGVQQAFDPKLFKSDIGQVTYNIDQGIVIDDFRVRDRKTNQLIAYTNHLESSLLRFLLQSSQSYLRIDSLSLDLRPFFSTQHESSSSSPYSSMNKTVNLSAFELKHGFFIIPIGTDSLLHLNNFKVAAKRLSLSSNRIQIKLDSLSGQIPGYNTRLSHLSGNFTTDFKSIRISSAQLEAEGNRLHISKGNLRLNPFIESKRLADLQGKLTLSALSLNPRAPLLERLQLSSNVLKTLQNTQIQLVENKKWRLNLNKKKWTTKGGLLIRYKDSTLLNIHRISFEPNTLDTQFKFHLKNKSKYIHTLMKLNDTSLLTPLVQNESSTVYGQIRFTPSSLDAIVSTPHFRIEAKAVQDSLKSEALWDITQTKEVTLFPKLTISKLSASGVIGIDSTKQLHANGILHLPHLSIFDKSYNTSSRFRFIESNLMQVSLDINEQASPKSKLHLDAKLTTDSIQKISLNLNALAFSLPSHFMLDSISSQMQLLIDLDTAQFYAIGNALVSFDKSSFRHKNKPYTLSYLDIDMKQKDDMTSVSIVSPNFLDLSLNASPKKTSNSPSNFKYLSPLLPREILRIISDYKTNIKLDASEAFLSLITNEAYSGSDLHLSLLNNRSLLFDINADRIEFDDLTVHDFEIFNYTQDQTLIMHLNSIEIDGHQWKNLSYTQKHRQDSLFSWILLNDPTIKISSYTETKLTDQSIHTHLKSTRINLNKDTWNLTQPFQFDYNFKDKRYALSGLEFKSSLDEVVEIFSSRLDDKHVVSGRIQNLQLKDPGKGYDQITVSYDLNLNSNFILSLNPDFSLDQFQSNITSKTHLINNVVFDSLDVNIILDPRTQQWQIGHTSFQSSKPSITSSGYIRNLSDYQFNFIFKKSPLNLIEYVALGSIRDFTGKFSGWLQVNSSTDGPVLNGSLPLHQAGFTIDYLHTPILLSDKSIVQFKDNQILFNHFTFTEMIGNTSAKVHGLISNKNLQDWGMHLDLEAEKLQFVNIPKKNSDQPFSGTISITGKGAITAKQSFAEVHLVSDVKIDGLSNVFIPLDKQVDASSSKFITFKQPRIKAQNQRIAEFNKGFSMDINVEVTPDAKITISSEDSFGDVIDLYCQGPLNLQLENSDLKLFGEINILRGNYLFTLNKTLRKQFEVDPSSHLIWNGKIDEGDFEIIARSQTRIRLDQFLLNYDNKTKVPVEIILSLTNSISDPKIDFDIRLPYEPEQIKTEFNSYMINNDEKRKQAFSVITTNSLITQDVNNLLFGGLSGATLGLLSAQFSKIVSSFSDDIELQLVYDNSSNIVTDNATQNTDNNLELAISRRFYNNRITINGNFGLNVTNQAPSSAYLGDIEVLWDLVGDNSINLRYYNKNNQVNNTNNRQQANDIVQGVGINIRQNFNSFSELFTKMLNIDNTTKK